MNTCQAHPAFRRYDLRGRAGSEASELSPAFAGALAAAIACELGEQRSQRFYVGRDERLSSPTLAAALIQGLVANGCQVVDLGAVPTPIVNFAIQNDPNPAGGAMVTASHNPPTDNGFKLYFGRQVASPEQLINLAELVDSGHDEAVAETGHLQCANSGEAYLEAMVAELTGERALRPRKIVIDTANAVASPIARTLFERLGMQVSVLNSEVNGHFPGHPPNPADPANLAQLQRAVVEQQAELGLAFDGDADRLVAISGDGAIVWPDRLLMLFAQQLLAQSPDSTVVYDIKCSHQLPQLVTAAGGKPLLCQTGHAFIRRALRDSDAALAGEFSGHFFFPDRWYPFDDGLYAGARLLQLLDRRDCSLAAAVAALPQSVSSDELLVPVADHEKFSLIETFIARANFPSAKINLLDGLRADFACGWGLVRASNTGPALTLRFEANTVAQLKTIQTQFADQLRPLLTHIDEYLPLCH
mgnify:CR=1 FL=1